jgi:sporulation protein YlmC with PRC-barrel domain
MDVKSLKGIAVVSIEQGEKVGVVDNVLFDLDPKRVIAFKLIKPGLLRSGNFILPMEDVESVGPDAVMIRNRDRIREQKGDRDYQNRPDLTSLSKLRVVTQDGTYVGTLATVQFEPKTGLITHLEVTGSGLMDRLRRNQIVDVAAGDEPAIRRKGHGVHSDTMADGNDRSRSHGGHIDRTQGCDHQHGQNAQIPASPQPSIHTHGPTPTLMTKNHPLQSPIR